jgi:hypothetical protein
MSDSLVAEVAIFSATIGAIGTAENQRPWATRRVHDANRGRTHAAPILFGGLCSRMLEHILTGIMRTRFSL